MSGDSQSANTPFLRILSRTLTGWLADTEVFNDILVQKLLAEAENLYQVLDFGLQYESTWEVAAWVACQTRLFASRLSQQGAWLGLVRRALNWCREAGLLQSELLLVQGQLQRDIDELQAAFATFANAEPLVTALDDVGLTVRLLYNQAETYFVEGQPQIASQLCQQALKQLDGGFDRLYWRAALLHILGNSERDLGNLERAQEILQEALELEKDAEDKLPYIRVLNSLGLISAWSRRLDEAQAAYDACLVLLQATPYNDDKLLLYSNAGSLHVSRQQWQAAQNHFHAAVTLARSQPVSRNNQAIAFNNMGYLLFRQNRLKEARYFLDEAIKLQRTLPKPLMLANSLGNLGHVLMAQSEKQLAQQTYDEALAALKPWLHMPRARQLWEEFEASRQLLA